MKTIVTIFVTLFVFTFNGYSQDKKVQAVLDSPEQRTEVFNAILNNHELMTEFMTAMKNSEHGMMMMMQNNKMEGMEGMHKNHEAMMEKDECNMKDGKMMGDMKTQKKMSCCAGNSSEKSTARPKHEHK